MKKVLNDPVAYVDEMLEGLCLAARGCSAIKASACTIPASSHLSGSSKAWANSQGAWIQLLFPGAPARQLVAGGLGTHKETIQPSTHYLLATKTGNDNEHDRRQPLRPVHDR